MRHTISFLVVSSFLSFLSAQTFANTPINLGYESDEHMTMGDQVVLKGLPSKNAFFLDNGIQLSYGEIIAMPDYYGDADHQITNENTFEKQKNRFLRAFNSFSQYDVAYFKAFWPIVEDEHNQVTAAIAAHQSVHELYKRIMDQEMLKLEVATNFKFFALAAKSFDHFGDDAWLAYQAGHSVAIDTAIAGYQIASGRDSNANAACEKIADQHTCLLEEARKMLSRAYEQNAYANHFLTDRLASSHMRTPFRALVTTQQSAELGGISGHYMHNEDAQYGVIVTNNSGNYWVAYGDDYYFEPQNAAHRAVIATILQQSADEIYDAFIKGYDPDAYSEQLEKLLPKPIPAGVTVSIPEIGSVTQSSPLFMMSGDLVLARQDVNNRYDNHWTPSWSPIQLMLTYHVS